MRSSFVSLSFFFIALHFFTSFAQISIPIQKRNVTEPYSSKYRHIKKKSNSFVDSLFGSDTLVNNVQYDINTTLYNSQNTQYFGVINVGSNKQNFTVIFDTGSDILWLPARYCDGCHGQSFDCSSSTTCTLTNNADSRQYGSGAISGYDATDMVGLTPDFQVQHDFILVESGDGLNMKSDGLMGLNNDNSIPNFVDLAYQGGYIQDKVFAFYMDTNQNPVSGISDGSYFTVGFIPEEHINNVEWLPVTQSNYWSTDVIAMALDGDFIDFSYNSDIENVLFDTGTSAILLADPIYKPFTEKLLNMGCKESGFFFDIMITCPCSNDDIKNYPNVTFYTRGVDFTITALDYLANPTFYETCVLMVDSTTLPLGLGQTTGMQILGDAFFRNNFVAFSKVNQTLGIEARLMNKLTPVPNDYNYMTGLVCLLIMIGVVIAASVLMNKFKPEPTFKAAPQQIGGSDITRNEAYANRYGYYQGPTTINSQ